MKNTIKAGEKFSHDGKFFEIVELNGENCICMELRAPKNANIYNEDQSKNPLLDEKHTFINLDSNRILALLKTSSE